ncbi:nicotinate (nicotinamide) nucleotide adenylyltransferase [Sulfuricurvum kujiense DSM 16994]|uniref:Probable nicotinate-nucleotide adenylyltransferase n=1 Tax=Sulfuricurvum kujiense (strain ATCC BAA-921 / DSM 16994 / JCM 11577 / YK-1) TaxID=709032 RepID=E4TYH6_SULKY|nr:nicotinate (nicotinamide) nucleotide adenylyltransferase [Sulfuricurvum kujiense]ADR32953.1 nicotinate (nicotinamide) nucleotide adenylyltransferase [Sulfuricurvum kujiense DSM 16994]
MKLALYGGSFDPPHAGHVAVVEEALRVLPIDRLIVVPASRNPFKPSVTVDGAVRFEWLKEIFKPYERVVISDFEIAHDRSVYTIETVKHFAPFCDELYLIIGADNLEKLSHWHNFDELDAMVHWVVADRDGISIPENMIRLTTHVPISSTDFRSSYVTLGLDPKIEQKIITYYKEHL